MAPTCDISPDGSCQGECLCEHEHELKFLNDLPYGTSRFQNKGKRETWSRGNGEKKEARGTFKPEEKQYDMRMTSQEDCIIRARWDIKTCLLDVGTMYFGWYLLVCLFCYFHSGLHTRLV